MWGPRLAKGLAALGLAMIAPSLKLAVSEVCCGEPKPSDEEVEQMRGVLNFHPEMTGVDARKEVPEIDAHNSFRTDRFCVFCSSEELPAKP